MLSIYFYIQFNHYNFSFKTNHIYLKILLRNVMHILWGFDFMILIIRFEYLRDVFNHK